jgi:predicted PurR-regulated permease PerM
MFKKGLKGNKKVVLKKDGHVRRDWVRALLVFMIVVALVIAISILIFTKTNSNQEVIVEEIATTEILDQELLEQTLEFYTKKEERFERYQREVPFAPTL